MMVIGAATDDQLSVLAPTGDGDGVALSRKAAQLLNRDTQSQIMDKTLPREFLPEQWAIQAISTLTPQP